jgi:hypothetical protein
MITSMKPSPSWLQAKMAARIVRDIAMTCILTPVDFVPDALSGRNFSPRGHRRRRTHRISGVPTGWPSQHQALRHPQAQPVDDHEQFTCSHVMHAGEASELLLLSRTISASSCTNEKQKADACGRGSSYIIATSTVTLQMFPQISGTT